ncbi:MAG: 30S ribosomal protein S27ae [Methanobacteriaceae archaeon]|jgi:small subunit ribosomal protein S27Ae|nr:MAG: 30S ribosomal protein S27ae [Methanobacterium sp. BRmetb2]MCC7557905.1 30S ribosomal protein S27ae [Methanobacteriaceae archaeon]
MKKSELYEVKDNKIIRKNPFCVRCSSGVFMADHGDRFACGKCGYTEWKTKEKQ